MPPPKKMIGWIHPSVQSRGEALDPAPQAMVSSVYLAVLPRNNSAHSSLSQLAALAALSIRSFTTSQCFAFALCINNDSLLSLHASILSPSAQTTPPHIYHFALLLKLSVSQRLIPPFPCVVSSSVASFMF